MPKAPKALASRRRSSSLRCAFAVTPKSPQGDWKTLAESECIGVVPPHPLKLFENCLSLNFKLLMPQIPLFCLATSYSASSGLISSVDIGSHLFGSSKPKCKSTPSNLLLLPHNPLLLHHLYPLIFIWTCSRLATVRRSVYELQGYRFF